MNPGSQVYLITDQDRRGTVSVQLCTVSSWGKQRIHLTDSVTGKPIQQPVYAKDVNRYLHPHVLAVAATPDLHAAAVEVAESFIELHRAHINRLINSDDFEQQNLHYRLCVRAKLAEFHAPRVLFNGNELQPKQEVQR